MKSQTSHKAVSRESIKAKIERWTLQILAIGVLIAVSLNVAKFAVRDYRELQREIHRQANVETYSQTSGER
jgi:hypothetical protein